MHILFVVTAFFLSVVLCIFKLLHFQRLPSLCYPLCSALLRYGSDNQKGANWHPTRAFHMLRGEAIAWIFALVMLEAVQTVEAGLRTSTKAQLLNGE